MPRHRRCGTCDGTGQELEMVEEQCPHCAGTGAGTGRDKSSDLWAGPYKNICRYCNGTGRRSYCRRSIRPCRSCDGSGTVQY
jgi:DnaJ-class molecular chaperone